jgi:hypothetical protein
VHDSKWSQSQNGVVPIVLDGNSINNYPFVCTRDQIIQQIGEPINIEVVDGRTVLYYDQTSAQKLYD